jgi:transposase
MSDGQRVALEALARSQVAPHRQVQRAKALMLAAEGMANSHIAEDLELSPTTVRAWRERFGSEGLAKLGEVRAGRGRKPSISDDKVTEIVNLTAPGRRPESHRPRPTDPN